MDVLAINHVAFEDLGSLGEVLADYGFRVRMIDAATTSWAQLDPYGADLVVVLGGPISVYRTASYPFLRDEIDWLELRLGRDRPTLGICLGAQLMAAALGANVYPGVNGKEIGWAPLRPGPDAEACPWLTPLLEPDLALLHWHGDTFDLPPGALHLASTAIYPHQAFAVGPHILGLQCHPEVTVPGLERWYVGHVCELRRAGIDVRDLRVETHRYGPRLQQAAIRFWREWIGNAIT